MFVFLQLLSVSYRIENNHIVSLRIDTYRIVWWPYRLIPSLYLLTRIVYIVHFSYTKKYVYDFFMNYTVVYKYIYKMVIYRKIEWHNNTIFFVK